MESPHLDCREHGLQCKKIADNLKRIEDIKKEHERMWAHIEKGVSIKVSLAILSLVVTLFLGMFGFSVQMNRSAIQDFNADAQGRKSQITTLFRTYGELTTSVASMKSELRSISKDVDELKGDIKEMKRDQRR